MSVFEDKARCRFNRDRLIAGLRGGQFDVMLARQVRGLEALSEAASVQAALNVIVFHFEPLSFSPCPRRRRATITGRWNR
jgi:hypothetical protein